MLQSNNQKSGMLGVEGMVEEVAVEQQETW
jgi:hypothetical protein